VYSTLIWNFVSSDPETLGIVRRYTWLNKTTQPGVQARPGRMHRVLPQRELHYPHPRYPTPWPRLVPISDWLTSRGKKGSQSSMFLLPLLADRLGRINPNLPSRRYEGARVVYCPGSHTTQNLISTTRIPSIPDTAGDVRQTHRPSPLQLGGKPPVATYLNLGYIQAVSLETPTVVVWEAPLGGIRLVCIQ